MERLLKLTPAIDSDFNRILSYLTRLEETERTPAEYRIDAETLRREWLGESRAESVFAEEDGLSVGFAICLPGHKMPNYPNALYVAAMFIEPGFRKHGIGRNLMGWMMQRAEAHGFTRLVMCCFTHNLPALAFCKHLGATVCGEYSVLTESGKLCSVRFYSMPITKQ